MNVTYDFTEENISRSPNQAGVYALYDASGIVYFGRATGTTVTIRSRLYDHKRGDGDGCTQSATHYSREVTSTPVAREKELLEHYKQEHGVLPRCNNRVG